MAARIEVALSSRACVSRRKSASSPGVNHQIVPSTDALLFSSSAGSRACPRGLKHQPFSRYRQSI